MDKQDGQDKTWKPGKTWLTMIKILVSLKTFVLQFWVAEVDEQAHFGTRGVQVVNDLSLMFWADGLDRFQVRANNYSPLPAFLSQSQKKSLLIDRFQKTRTQFIDHFKSTTNHSFCYLFVF